MIRNPLVFAALATSLATAGCTGWATANAGPTYSAAGRQGRTGGNASIDTILSPQPHTFFNRGSAPLPVGFHSAVETILTPDLKSFGWQTGVAVFWMPRPVAGFIALGTDLHFDGVDGYFSFGNFQPYGQIGLVSSLGEGKFAPLFTLTGQAEYFIHYLAYLHDDEPKTDLFIAIKLGIGFEIGSPDSIRDAK
ncbi:MAG TPA: hypothetical protein VF407_01650 [Polyangiaceae bacterium]